MANNMALGGDGQTNHTLSVLRDRASNGALATNVAFMPGVKLNADPTLELSGSFKSPKGRLLELDAQTGPNPGGWVGLHIELPLKNLDTIGVLGFAARIAAPEILVIRACVRSGTKGGFEDCFFDKHLLLRSEDASHIDALSVDHYENLPARAPWRELVLFLPTHAFSMSLVDLRVFAV